MIISWSAHFEFVYLDILPHHVDALVLATQDHNLIAVQWMIGNFPYCYVLSSHWFHKTWDCMLQGLRSHSVFFQLPSTGSFFLSQFSYQLLHQKSHVCAIVHKQYKHELWNPAMETNEPNTNYGFFNKKCYFW